MSPCHPARSSPDVRLRRAGFTLLEMIVAMAVVAAAMVVVVQAMGRVQSTWSETSAKVREAMDARAGMETLTRTLPRAVLDPRWAMDQDGYSPSLQRDSDLHFVSGPAATLLSSPVNMTGHAVFFQTPTGHGVAGGGTQGGAAKAEYDTLPGVLNAWGYFVEFGDDPAPAPAFLSDPRFSRSGGQAAKRRRFRLMEFRQPAHELGLFEMKVNGDATVPLISLAVDQRELYRWFDEPLRERPGSGRRRCSVVAENILALVVEPLRPAAGDPASGAALVSNDLEAADDYLYDSRRFQWDAGSTRAMAGRHRLPPALRVTLIVLEERDWSKLSDSEAEKTGGEMLRLVSSKFTSPKAYDTDIGAITGELNRRRMKHRVTTTTLQLPGGLGAAGPDVTQP